MHIICSSRGVIDKSKPAQGIRDITEAGYQGLLLDISTVCPPGELENFGEKNPKQGQSKKIQVSRHPEALFEEMRKVVEQCEKERLLMIIGRAPYLAEDSRRNDLNALLERLAVESIKICGRAGCRYVIISPLSAGTAQGLAAKADKEYYLRLAGAAKENGVQILLENQCRDINGHLVRGFCSDGSEAAEWVDELNREAGEELFGFCVDVGSCNLCSMNMYEFSSSLGRRLKAVRLRECTGNEQSSMLPFTGAGRGQSQTDWLDLIRGLRRAEFDGELIMDFAGTMAVSPLILRPEWIRMSKLVADYFKWQIEMERTLKKYPVRVLFGAGNMCRNYMKCYGEEYPPLFTCDNDSRRWGGRFEGLEIKPPEALRETAPDCAIFICNIYYREIERQLREMGISNPIEYFNDEHMPSFYFERLEYWEGET